MIKNYLLIPILLVLFLFIYSSAFTANRFVRAAGGDFNVASTWSGTGSGGVDVVAVPTAADNVFLQIGSGQLTINVNSVCRSIDANAYTNTITHATGVTLTIGDGTAGTGNIALRFGTGITYSPADATSAISFVPTSATVQTVNFGGKTTGNVIFNASGLNGIWRYSTAHTTLSTATVTLTRGTLNTNGQTCTWGLFTSNDGLTRTLTLGASTITLTGVGNVWDMRRQFTVILKL